MKILSISATDEEFSRMQTIMEKLQRKTISDCLRVMINQTYDKILNENTSISVMGNNQKETPND